MGQERREYFRIDDTAAVEYVAVSDADPRSKNADDFFSVTPSFQLLSRLQEIDQEANKVLNALRDSQRELVGYLKLVAKKTDLLAAAVLQLDVDAQNRPQPVTLSAGGISFATQQQFAEGDLLALRIQLVNEALFLCCFGRVVGSDANENKHGSYGLAVAFERMPGAAQTLLARHIMRCERALQRQKLKRNRAPGNVV